YADRLTSGRVAVYSGAVADQFHAYPRPQETGNKTDVRWMALTGDGDIGLVAVGDRVLSASVWPFDMQELEFVPAVQGAESASGLVPIPSRHGADIEVGGVVTWNLDDRQMGVGGDTSWGRPVHEPYTIAPREYSYRFVLIPYQPSQDRPGELARGLFTSPSSITR
ncbi:MAG TPA: beta-galactosidase, partial [Phycisphaerae bacterium]|nr:beta-galactosidase [Phycisphaerae bacterium]